MCGTSISSTCLSTGDRQAPTAFFLWRNVFCSLYVLWAPPISYCIFLWENIFLHFVCALSTANILLHYSSEESFLQFECALSTANVLLNSSCEESFSAVWMCSEHLQSFCEESFSSVCVTLPLIGRFDQRLHHMGPFEKYISICILGHIGHLNTRRLHLWQVEDDGPNLPCDTCDSKGWLLCDFCQGQKVNVQVRANKFYRRCPSCRAVSS